MKKTKPASSSALSVFKFERQRSNALAFFCGIGFQPVFVLFTCASVNANHNDWRLAWRAISSTIDLKINVLNCLRCQCHSFLKFCSICKIKFFGECRLIAKLTDRFRRWSRLSLIVCQMRNYAHFRNVNRGIFAISF